MVIWLGRWHGMLIEFTALAEHQRRAGIPMDDGVAVITIDSTYRLACMAFPLGILQPPDQLSLLSDMLDWMLP